MTIHTRITRRTGIYSKSEVYDPDTVYFHQEMKENDATHLFNMVHKEFVDFLSKGVIELVTHSRVIEGDKLFTAVWDTNQKMGGTNKGDIQVQDPT